MVGALRGVRQGPLHMPDPGFTVQAGLLVPRVSVAKVEHLFVLNNDVTMPATFLWPFNILKAGRRLVAHQRQGRHGLRPSQGP